MTADATLSPAARDLLALIRENGGVSLYHSTLVELGAVITLRAAAELLEAGVVEMDQGSEDEAVLFDPALSGKVN